MTWQPIPQHATSAEADSHPKAPTQNTAHPNVEKKPNAKPTGNSCANGEQETPKRTPSDANEKTPNYTGSAHSAGANNTPKKRKPKLKPTAKQTAKPKLHASADGGNLPTERSHTGKPADSGRYATQKQQENCAHAEPKQKPKATPHQTASRPNGRQATRHAASAETPSIQTYDHPTLCH